MNSPTARTAVNTVLAVILAINVATSVVMQDWRLLLAWVTAALLLAKSVYAEKWAEPALRASREEVIPVGDDDVR